MLQTQESEVRAELARPHFIRALETTLDVQRESLFHELARSRTPFDQQLVRDQIRDLAKLIQNGIRPLADHWHAEGIDTAFKFRLKRILDALYDYAHPQSPLPQPLPDASIAEALLQFGAKLDAIAIGVELLHRKAGGSNGC